jgi:hypothetical protein
LFEVETEFVVEFVVGIGAVEERAEGVGEFVEPS